MLCLFIDWTYYFVCPTEKGTIHTKEGHRIILNNTATKNVITTSNYSDISLNNLMKTLLLYCNIMKFELFGYFVKTKCLKLLGSLKPNH